MKLLFVILAVLITTQYSHSAACPLSSASGVSAGNGTCDVSDGTTGTTIQLNFNSGFDSTILIENDNAAALATDTYLNTGFAATVVSDSATASIASGNNGATVGAQRKLSFIKAAEIIASQLVSAETIIVDADFTALTCSSGGGTLGSAGAAANLGNVSVNKNGDSNPPAGQIANTFYPIALLNAMGSDDYDAGSDVNANYNLNIGASNCIVASNGWYYGFDAPASVHYDEDVNGNPISWNGGADIIIDYTAFTTVLLHEMLHGFGFASLTNASTGAKASGIDDIFSNFLYSESDSDLWTVAAALTNGERAASAISDTGLLWAGTNVNTQAVGVLTDGFNNSGTGSSVLFEADDKVEMYAPNPVESGSSVSHFNTAASPNEIMEPQYTEYLESLGLALYLLQDIGWGINDTSNTTPTITITGTPYSTNEDTEKVIDASSWDADADGDTVTFTVSSCPANITCAIDSDGQNLTLTPASNYNGATNSVEITVTDDGTGNLSASASFNLAVIAQNDAPEWSAISTQSVTIGGSSVDVDLSGYATDVDGHTISYSQVSCGTGLSCSLSSSTMTLSGISNAGATVTVEVQADDNNGEQTNTTFSVSINAAAANTSPTITAINQTTAEDTPLTIDISSWGNDAEDTLVYSVPTNCASNITCSIDTDGTNFVITPSANHNGDTHTITVTVDDSTNSTVTDSFNLTVSAVDDDPTLDTAITDQTTAEDTVLTFNVSDLATDVDSGDSLSYSITTCAININCSINSDGSILTLTPDADHNGASHTVTVSVSDANGGTAVTDSFNLNVTAVNDAPTLDNPGNMSIEVNTTLSFDLTATDVENDNMTYAVSASSALAGASIVNNTVTLLPTEAGSYQVTVSASDANLSTEQTFTINVFEVPTVSIDSTTLQPNDSANIENTAFEIDVTGVASNFDFSLDFEGSASDALLDLSGDRLTIGMPTSGQFAGTYTLTVSDTATGESYDYTLVREPRLVFSATKLLENSVIQTLKIEGGAAGTVYSLTSSETGLSFSQSNAAITDVTASDDADNYNPADVALHVGTIISSTSVNISVSSIFETAMSNDISLEPKATHIITVQDNGSAPLAQSTIELDMSLLTAFNIPESYTTDSAGQSTVTLPSDDSNYSAEVQLSGYTSQSITLNRDSTEQTITLEKVINPLNLSGTISGDGDITFTTELPTVELTLTDNTKVSLPVSLLHSNQAEFNYIHDLNTGDVRSLTISHSDSETIEVNLLTRNSLVFDIHLSKQVQVVVISSESAGTIHPLNLIFLLLLLLTFRRRRLIT